MQTIGNPALCFAAAIVLSCGVQAAPVQGKTSDVLESQARISTLSTNETPDECESIRTEELITCMSERLASADAALKDINDSNRDRLGSRIPSGFKSAHQRWLEARDRECETVFRQAGSGREASIDHLLCLEQRTLVRVRQLSGETSSGLARCSRPEATVRFFCGSARGDLVKICEAPDPRGRGSDPPQFHMESIDAYGSSVSLGPPEARLRYNHYTRLETDYLEVAARISGVEYRVFRHHENSLVSYGMVTRRLDELEVRIDCTGEVFDQLPGLATVLECDTENALGCGVPGSSALLFD